MQFPSSETTPNYTTRTVVSGADAGDEDANEPPAESTEGSLTA